MDNNTVANNNVETTAESKVTEEKASSNNGPVLYTEHQVRAIYDEAQKNGYITAIKQMRADINDYLNDLLIRLQQQ